MSEDFDIFTISVTLQSMTLEQNSLWYSFQDERVLRIAYTFNLETLIYGL